MEHETHGQLVFVPELFVGIDENLLNGPLFVFPAALLQGHAIQPTRHRHRHHPRHR
jgi:hypothetical protein